MVQIIDRMMEQDAKIEEIHAMMKEQSEILKAIGRREGVADASSNRKSIIGRFLKKH